MGSWSPPPVMKLDQPDPPAYHSPFDSRAKLMNLQNLALQQQEGQQNLQVGQLNIADKQRQIAERKAINEAYMKAMPLDENGKPKLDENGRPQFDDAQFMQALSLAGHGSAGTPVLEANTKYRKSLADLDEVKGKVTALHQDAVGHMAAGVQAGNNDPHLYLTHVTQALQSGAMTAAEAKAVMDPVTAALDQDPTGESARALVKNITDQMIAGSPKERELATSRVTADATAVRDKAQATLADISSLEKGMGMAAQSMPVPAPAAPGAPPALPTQEEWDAWRNGVTDPRVKDKIPPKVSATSIAMVNRMALTREQQQQADQAKATLAEQTRRDTANMGNSETELAVIATNPNETPERRASASAALKRLDQSKVASRPVNMNTFQIPGLGGPGGQAGGGATQLTGEEFLSSLPQATAAQIRAIAEGRTNMPPATSRQPAALALRDAVFKFDPTFNDQRAQIRKAFTTGPDGRNIGNLNTAPVHLDQLYDAAVAMKNGSFQPGNEAWNRLQTIFGSSTPTNFDALKVTVSGEMANALKGVATDPEIAHINETLSRAKSPEQLAGVIQEDLQSIAGKLKTYQERAQQQDVGKWSPVLPSAAAVFQRHGIDPVTLKKAGASGAGGGTAPAGTIAVPLKSGRTAYMAPDAAAKFKTEHPELVK